MVEDTSFPSAWLRRVAAVRSVFVLGGSSLFSESQSVGKFGKFPAVIGPRGAVVKNEDSTQHTPQVWSHTSPPPPTNTKKIKEIKCQPVIFKVLTCERNCACNYEQAEVLAYKQEKLTASWVFAPVFWLAVCLAVALAFILVSCLRAFFGHATSGGEASPFPHILLACDKQSAQENVLCTTVVTWVVSCHFWQNAGPNVCECNILWESVRAREGRKAGRGCNFSTTMTAVVSRKSLSSIWLTL